MKQIKPCPKCKTTSGWFQVRYMRYEQFFDKDGNPDKNGKFNKDGKLIAGEYDPFAFMRFVDLMVDGKFCQTVSEFYKMNWIGCLNWRAWQLQRNKEIEKANS